MIDICLFVIRVASRDTKWLRVRDLSFPSILRSQTVTSCKIITLSLLSNLILSKVPIRWLKQIVMNGMAWRREREHECWDQGDINHTTFHSTHFSSSASSSSVVYFTFRYILISSTVHHSFKLVVLKFLLVSAELSRAWDEGPRFPRLRSFLLSRRLFFRGVTNWRQTRVSRFIGRNVSRTIPLRLALI